MKISRGIFFVTLLFAANQLLAQSNGSFVPIFVGKSGIASEFVEGETLISQIDFTGLDIELSDEGEGHIYASDFLKLLREQRIGAPRENEPLSGYKVFLTTKKLKEWLSEYGYENASVSALGMRLPENRMRLTFSVERGPLLKTAEIRFVGNDRVSNTALAENLKGCLGAKWERYDRSRYEYFTEKCSRSLMHSKGFFEAKILDIRSQVRDGVRDVIVQVAEGPRYLLGKVSIEGNQILSTDEILASFGQKTGDVADGPALKDFVYEKLKQKYDALGYVQYNAEFEPELKKPIDWKQDGLVNVSISIDEGHQFKVRRIFFAGVDNKEGESLLGEFLLKAGDIMSAQKLREAINQLNEQKRFEIVDQDQDVDIRTDEKGAEVGLVITLRKLHS
jgi:outer membrane protein insertion porin family